MKTADLPVQPMAERVLSEIPPCFDYSAMRADGRDHFARNFTYFISSCFSSLIDGHTQGNSTDADILLRNVQFLVWFLQWCYQRQFYKSKFGAPFKMETFNFKMKSTWLWDRRRSQLQCAGLPLLMYERCCFYVRLSKCPARRRLSSKRDYVTYASTGEQSALTHECANGSD